MITTHSSQWQERKDNKTKSEEEVTKTVTTVEGGYKSSDDNYTYIRGRGRGKYICDSCGIRCKKPSMLKKHIRTHTNVRPYTCKYCNFSFKTKGNLTKHMKSKAHSKKCVELGIVPVPTQADDDHQGGSILDADGKSGHHGGNKSGGDMSEDDMSEDGEDVDDLEDEEDEDMEIDVGGGSTPNSISTGYNSSSVNT